MDRQPWQGNYNSFFHSIPFILITLRDFKYIGINQLKHYFYYFTLEISNAIVHRINHAQMSFARIHLNASICGMNMNARK